MLGKKPCAPITLPHITYLHTAYYIPCRESCRVPPESEVLLQVLFRDSSPKLPVPHVLDPDSDGGSSSFMPACAGQCRVLADAESGTSRQALSAVDSVADVFCLCVPLCSLLKKLLEEVEVATLPTAAILALWAFSEVLPVALRCTCPGATK